MKAFDTCCNDDNESVVIGFRAVIHSIVCRVHSTKFCDGWRGAAGRRGGGGETGGRVSALSTPFKLGWGVGVGGEREGAVRALATQFRVGWGRERTRTRKH